jgi:uncharacterized protein YbjT (DUF2867 family)
MVELICLITGATGASGGAAVRELRKQGRRVRGLVRKDDARAEAPRNQDVQAPRNRQEEIQAPRGLDVHRRMAGRAIGAAGSRSEPVSDLKPGCRADDRIESSRLL